MLLKFYVNKHYGDVVKVTDCINGSENWKVMA